MRARRLLKVLLTQLVNKGVPLPLKANYDEVSTYGASQGSIPWGTFLFGGEI